MFCQRMKAEGTRHFFQDTNRSYTSEHLISQEMSLWPGNRNGYARRHSDFTVKLIVPVALEEKGLLSEKEVKQSEQEL